MRRLLFSIFVLISGAYLSVAFGEAHACGLKSDCKVASGDYRIYMPELEGNEKKIPAIIHIHGLWRSSKATVERGDFRRLARKLGVAIVGANGISQSWTFPNGVKRGKVRNEIRYFREVMTDITKRFPIDPNRIVISGFSIGASMTWYLACLNPGRVAGYIPVAGTMWRPQPNNCARSIGNIHHYHGTADTTFPLTGRFVSGKKQGDITVTQALMFRQDGCTRKIVDTKKIRGLKCNRHRNCGGEELRFCIHGGDHHIKAFYLEDGFRRIAKAKAWTLRQ